MICDSQEVINNPANKRQELLAQKIIRGDIVSADGKVLATTRTDKKGNETRVYPYGEVFCHAVGRVANSKTGVELEQSFPLLTSHVNPLKQLVQELRGEKKQGDQVVTTLDAALQQAAYEALGDHKGAVVALEPSTGKILAMVSKPSYDPNTVSEEWDSLVEDSAGESPLLNRATQGLYPPGSTFKLLTAIEYMRENASYDKYQYTCQGSDTFGGNTIRCYGGERHGLVDLKSSLADSCNGSFAHIGTGLRIKSFRKLCEKFGFNNTLSVSFEYNKSVFSLNGKSDQAEVAQTSIGQGKTTVTPLENALISAAIANGGEMMTPYLVDRVESVEGTIVKQYEPQVQQKVIGKKLAGEITQMMKAVVTDGTASSLGYLSYSVAGKTGTAEYDSDGTSHAWFVGFAPADSPEIAVSVIVEGAGTGSQYAVPVAEKLFRTYLGN
jgi:peptidoglycan glycosyltransferase